MNGMRTGVLRWALLGAVLVLMIGVAIAMLQRNDDTPNGNGNGTDATPEPGSGFITSPLQIELVDVLILESYPQQYMVHVKGIIPDSCTTAREPEIQEDDQTITITILGEKPAGVACAQVISDYEQNIPLGTRDPGEYTVIVNGVTATFTAS